MERSLDGDSAGVLIPSIVISSNGQSMFQPICVFWLMSEIVNHSRESLTRTGDWTDTRYVQIIYSQVRYNDETKNFTAARYEAVIETYGILINTTIINSSLSDF